LRLDKIPRYIKSINIKIKKDNVSNSIQIIFFKVFFLKKYFIILLFNLKDPFINK
jgi:hypothetical protein